MNCGRLTRRTVLVSYGVERWASERFVCCNACPLPTAEARLLMAIYGVETIAEMDAVHEKTMRQMDAGLVPDWS
jgi:hypothetical protein